MYWEDLLKFIHILGVVFMSMPLYNLIIVNERALFGPGMVLLRGSVHGKPRPQKRRPVP